VHGIVTAFAPARSLWSSFPVTTTSDAWLSTIAADGVSFFGSGPRAGGLSAGVAGAAKDVDSAPGREGQAHARCA
jgi:hypothetical protein